MDFRAAGLLKKSFLVSLGAQRTQIRKPGAYALVVLHISFGLSSFGAGSVVPRPVRTGHNCSPVREKIMRQTSESQKGDRLLFLAAIYGDKCLY